MKNTIHFDGSYHDLALRCYEGDCPLRAFRLSGMICFFDKPCRMITGRDWKRLSEWDKLVDYGIVFVKTK